MNSQPRNSGHWDELGYLPPERRPGRAAAGSQASAPGAPAWCPPAPQPRICQASPGSPSPEPRPPCTRAGGTLDALFPLSSAHPRPGHRTRTEPPQNPPRPRGARSQLGPLISTPALRAPRGASAHGIAAVPAPSGGRTGGARGSDRSRRAPRPCSLNPLGAPPSFGSRGRGGTPGHRVSGVGPAKAVQGGGTRGHRGRGSTVARAPQELFKAQVFSLLENRKIIKTQSKQSAGLSRTFQSQVGTCLGGGRLTFAGAGLRRHRAEQGRLLPGAARATRGRRAGRLPPNPRFHGLRLAATDDGEGKSCHRLKRPDKQNLSLVSAQRDFRPQDVQICIHPVGLPYFWLSVVRSLRFLCVRGCVGVCVGVCVRERERERERD